MPKGKQKASLKKHRQIPYARGFKPPSVDKCLSAISHPSLSLSDLPSHLQPSQESFSPLPKPTSIDDWLAQYKEPGQTFTQFTNDTPWLSSRKWRGVGCSFNNSGTTIKDRYIESAIYLIPLGDFNNDTRLAPKFTDLVNYVEIFYNLPVKLIDSVKLESERNLVYLRPTSNPQSSTSSRGSTGSSFLLESRHNSKTRHRQLRVSSILIALRQMMPSDALFVMALTMEDLYEDKPDLFVAGMAAGNHRVGVFSFCRYDPTCTFSSEFWYDIKREKGQGKKREQDNKRLILQRSCKLLVHELAHLLGVDHCIWFDCCMNGSGHLEEDDVPVSS